MSCLRSVWAFLLMVALAVAWLVAAPRSVAAATPKAVSSGMSTAFVPVPASRIVDTRSGTGARRGVVPADGSLTF